MERSPNYDEPFCDILAASKPSPTPRKEIFDTFIAATSRSCLFPDDTSKARVRSLKIEYDRSQFAPPQLKPLRVTQEQQHKSTSRPVRVSKYKRYFEERCYLGPASNRNDMHSPSFDSSIEDYQDNLSNQIAERIVIKKPNMSKNLALISRLKITTQSKKLAFTNLQNPPIKKPKVS